jgi:hypothetical protein
MKYPEIANFDFDFDSIYEIMIAYDIDPEIIRIWKRKILIEKRRKKLKQIYERNEMD